MIQIGVESTLFQNLGGLDLIHEKPEHFRLNLIPFQTFKGFKPFVFRHDCVENSSFIITARRHYYFYLAPYCSDNME